MKFEAEGRTFHYVDHDVRTATSAGKFCHLHMRGRLARVNTESLHKKVIRVFLKLRVIGGFRVVGTQPNCSRFHAVFGKKL